MQHHSKILPFASLSAVILLLLVIIASWIISSVNPSLHVRSLISEEGIRHILGGFTTCMATPILIWILVCSISYGTFTYSGLYDTIVNTRKGIPITYRQKYALIVASVLLFISCIIIFLLAFVPHAALLGITGSLYPSSLSSGLIPLFAFISVIVSLAYGITCGKLTDMDKIFTSLYIGIKISAPIWPLYIFIMQLYYAIMFAFFE